VHAPRIRIAGITGAAVAITTIEGARSAANTVSTNVARGAGISIIAGIDIGDVDAAHCRVAGIGGADIVVVAGEEGTALALAVGAEVFHCAEVLVVAIALGGVVFAQTIAADVIGAKVEIITVYGRAAGAGSFNARIVDSATVAIAAWTVSVLMLATTFSETDVLCAEILIVAIEGAFANALAAAAGISCRAGVLVVAGVGVFYVNTPVSRVTKVVSTKIPVVAIG